MRHDSRLPRVLHALLHLEHMAGPATSDMLATMLGTNASVVRRTMGGLREAGIVAASKGHGGGWTLARPLAQITLLDIYTALGSPALFAIGSDDDDTTCLLARAANRATLDALAQARQRFEQQLAAVSVADLKADWSQEMHGHPHGPAH